MPGLKMSATSFYVPVFRKDIEREVTLMKSVGNHAHVLSLIGYSDLYGGRLAILLELCSNGDLLTWLRQHQVRLSRTEEVCQIYGLFT